MLTADDVGPRVAHVELVDVDEQLDLREQRADHRHAHVPQRLAAEAVDHSNRSQIHGSKNGTGGLPQTMGRTASYHVSHQVMGYGQTCLLPRLRETAPMPLLAPSPRRGGHSVSRALDELVRILDLEPIEVNLFRGTSPDEDRQRVFGGQVAGQALVAAARTVERGQVHSLHAYFLRPGDPTHPDPLRGRPHPRRQELHHPPGRGHPARPGDLQPARPASTCDEARPRPPAPDARRARPRVAARLQDADGAATSDHLGEWYDRPRPFDLRYVGPTPVERTRARRHHPAGVAAGRRRAARRPGAARLHRHLRVRHDPARHHAAAPRHLVDRRPRADGQPRPRHVVPPAVPGRRVAAVRPGHALDLDGARAWRAVRSSPGTAVWWSRWCRRA